MFLASIILLLFTIPVTWWLSGHDPGLTNENPRRDLIHRAVLCTVTVILAEVLIFLPKDTSSMPFVLIIACVLFLVWHRCTGEFFAGCFHRLIDPEDKRKFDPNEGALAVDQVAVLLKCGQREEAVKLVDELKKSGAASVQVLETMLARAGVEREDFKLPRPLVEASRLRAQGKFSEAEAILQSLLKESPVNADAALMLARLYAQDLRRADKAAEILHWLKTQPQVPPAAVEYAILSVHEWSREKPKPVEAALPESVDELLAGGYLGTAIEILERKTREQPRDFGAWLKLAEAYAAHSGNFHRAEKIVRQMESSRGFDAEQIQMAKAKLKEWRAAAKAKR